MEINRKTAFEVLVDIEKKSAYANISLNNHIAKNRPDDPAFVRELCYGVIKNKLLLDYVLKYYVSRGYHKLHVNDAVLLRMGAYQLLKMNAVPDYAAVSETVELAKHFAHGRERFINGVLRSLAGKKFDIKYPTVDKDPWKYLSIMYSCNEWIVDILIATYGIRGAEEYLKASNLTPDLCIRVNILKTYREELIGLLTEAGFEATPSEHTDRGIIVKGTGLLNTSMFQAGLFSVQDEASIIASDTVAPKRGEFIVDCCAAPGGKTAAIAEEMNNDGRILAMDIYENKIGQIEKLCKSHGIDIVSVEAHDSTKRKPELISKADRVLCDVPCSGLGVIRRKPEIKYSVMKNLDALYDKQRRILNASSAYVKKGGALIYSTCTVNPMENGKQVERFLEDNKKFSLEREIHLTPLIGTDGFYIAKMIREE